MVYTSDVSDQVNSHSAAGMYRMLSAVDCSKMCIAWKDYFLDHVERLWVQSGSQRSITSAAIGERGVCETNPQRELASDGSIQQPYELSFLWH